MKKNFFFLLLMIFVAFSVFGATSDEKSWVIASTAFTIEAEDDVFATVKPFEKLFSKLLEIQL